MNRILIAEDETRIAAFIQKGLGKNGFSTVVAPDGQQAIEMALAEEFELLLLDLGLPVKDGWTVLTELRRQQKKIPIIVVTAINDDRSRLEALNLGATDYVAKPFIFSDLLAKVKLQVTSYKSQIL
ncbi:MAG: response regulator transcription factor [Calothrix sp. CSU_2_0]|nr:response regulator transcription factor [Calothrix sp. CSU_2_0]